MERVAEKIEVKVHISKKGKMKPIEWHILEDNEYVTIEVIEVKAWKTVNRMNGVLSGEFGSGLLQRPAYIYYYCCSKIQSRMTNYILKYDIDKDSWTLDEIEKDMNRKWKYKT